MNQQLLPADPTFFEFADTASDDPKRNTSYWFPALKLAIGFTHYVMTQANRIRQLDIDHNITVTRVEGRAEGNIRRRDLHDRTASSNAPCEV